MTKSGESLFSRGSPIGANNLAAAANNSNTSNAQGTGNTTAGSNLTASQGTTLTDSSVLLGLEELERQQADVEKRRAEKQLAEQRAAQLAQQQPQQQQLQQGGHPRHSAGLPPLAPSSGPAQFPPGMLQQLRPTSAPAGVGGGPGASSHNKDVPSQIHLLEGDDEDAHTILSSDVAPGGGGGERNKELKRVVSIEKIRGVSYFVHLFLVWRDDLMCVGWAEYCFGGFIELGRLCGIGCVLCLGVYGLLCWSYQIDGILHGEACACPPAT